MKYEVCIQRPAFVWVTVSAEDQESAERVALDRDSNGRIDWAGAEVDFESDATVGDIEPIL